MISQVVDGRGGLNPDRRLGATELDDDVARRTARDWLVDSLLFLVAVGFTALVIVDSVEQHVAAGPVAVEAAFGVASCLGVWLRRRWPVGFAVVVGLMSIYAITASGIVMIALFTVAVHRRVAVVVPIAVGLALTSALTPVVRPDTAMPNWWQAVLGVVATAAILAGGMYVRVRRQLIASLRERARRAESEQDLRLQQARQLERNRIAREMHDVLAHRISLVSLHAGALELRPDLSADEIARAAGVIRSSAHQALEDLRQVIGVLREDGPSDDWADSPDHPLPTLVDVPALIEESRRAGTPVRLECRLADLATVPSLVGRDCYRIVQEGLTNARKHAREAEVSVIIWGAEGDGLNVELHNPWPAGGAGTAGIPGTGTGLVGLAERASLNGGWLEHGRTASGDFRLSAWLPWPV